MVVGYAHMTSREVPKALVRRNNRVEQVLSEGSAGLAGALQASRGTAVAASAAKENLTLSLQRRLRVPLGRLSFALLPVSPIDLDHP